MEGKLIFSYHKLGNILQGGLSVPSIARDLDTTLLPLGAATGADPMGMLQGDHWDPPPAKIPLGFVSNFPCEHQTSNTITVQQVLMLSGEQGRIIGKIRGVFVWYSVRERWWEGRAQLQATTQGQGMMQHPKGEAPGAGRGGTLELPRGAVPKPQEQILRWERGWEDWKLQGQRVGSHCIALALGSLHLLHGACCGNVYFCCLVTHPTSLISVHLTVWLLNNLLHKWVSIPRPPLPSPLERAMHCLWEFCMARAAHPKNQQILNGSLGLLGLGRGTGTVLSLFCHHLSSCKRFWLTKQL